MCCHDGCRTRCIAGGPHDWPDARPELVRLIFVRAAVADDGISAPSGSQSCSRGAHWHCCCGTYSGRAETFTPFTTPHDASIDPLAMPQASAENAIQIIDSQGIKGDCPATGLGRRLRGFRRLIAAIAVDALKGTETNERAAGRAPAPPRRDPEYWRDRPPCSATDRARIDDDMALATCDLFARIKALRVAPFFCARFASFQMVSTSGEVVRATPSGQARDCCNRGIEAREEAAEGTFAYKIHLLHFERGHVNASWSAPLRAAAGRHATGRRGIIVRAGP